MLEDWPALFLHVLRIDENYYKYLVTLAQYHTTDETPLTDRAWIYNNIEGGYGIFGSQNGITCEIYLE